MKFFTGFIIIFLFSFSALAEIKTCKSLFEGSQSNILAINIFREKKRQQEQQRFLENKDTLEKSYVKELSTAIEIGERAKKLYITLNFNKGALFTESHVSILADEINRLYESLVAIEELKAKGIALPKEQENLAKEFNQILPVLLEITNPDSEFRAAFQRKADEEGWDLSETRILNRVIFHKMDAVALNAFYLKNRIENLSQRLSNLTTDITSFFEVQSSFAKIFEDFATEVLREKRNDRYFIKSDVDQVMTQTQKLNQGQNVQKILDEAEKLGFKNEVEQFKKDQDHMNALIERYFFRGIHLVQ